MGERLCSMLMCLLLFRQKKNLGKMAYNSDNVVFLSENRDLSGNDFKLLSNNFLLGVPNLKQL